jgi:hypothetical protein
VTTLDQELPQRAWHFKQLKWSLQALAAAGSRQPALFPETSPGADDLAFGFSHWASLVREAYRTDLTAAQARSIVELEKKLAVMSRDGAEFEVELWTDAALASSEHWRDVRRLATEALVAFAWADQEPARDPDQGSGPEAADR